MTEMKTTGATRLAFMVVVLVGCAVSATPAVGVGQVTGARDSRQLVDRVLGGCVHMDCVKREVLQYLDNVLHIGSGSGSRVDAGRNVKNIDQAIFKRAARFLTTNEFRFKLPEMIFGSTEMVYNPITGLDVTESKPDEGRGILKKKLFLPILLLLKLKMKALMPIFVLIAKIKAVKALILSKLALGVVIGFIIYQMMSKSGMPMPMPMTITPIEPPSPPPNMYGPPTNMYGPPTNMYGPPPSLTTSPPSSYEPSWEPSPGNGPYSRVWSPSSGSTSSDLPSSSSGSSQSLSSYYSTAGGSGSSSSLNR